MGLGVNNIWSLASLVGLGVLATVVIDVGSGVRFCVFRGLQGLPDYASITILDGFV